VDRLIVMANQIADFFAPYPSVRRAEGIRNHLRTYWDPRMRQDLVDYIAAGGEGLSPSIADGVRLLTNGEEKKGYYGPPKA
jgi:formate dehydrogenase subunit delta